MGTPRRPHHFTEEQIDRARLLRRDGTSWDRLGELYHCSPETIRRRLDDEYKQRRSDRYRPEHGAFVVHANAERISPNEAARAIGSVPADTRSRLGRLMGDPLPGRSALDRLRKPNISGTSTGCAQVGIFSPEGVATEYMEDRLSIGKAF